MNDRPLIICAVGYADSTHVAARTRCFAERGHRVFLITECPSADGIAGVTELVPRLQSRGLAGLAVRAASWILRRLSINPDHAWRALSFVTLLRRCRPDVIHVHFAYSYYAWLAGVIGCGPLVVTVMGGDVLFEEQGSPTPMGKWLTLELLKQADFITTKSDHLTTVLDRLGGFGDKAERIVWGISMRRFRRVDATALRSRLGLLPRHRVVLSPKILQPFYRIHLVIDAMADVVRREPDAVLLVTEYGADAEYKASIEARAAELGISDHVRFCGRVDHGDMPAYYSLAEMTVAVPSSDGLPQTLLEGMACETPSILGRLPRYEEIVEHRESAYFVDADPDSIAAGIIEVFADSSLRARIALNALGIVREQADLDEQAERVERHYRRLAGSRRPLTWSLTRMMGVLFAYRRRRDAHGS